MKKLLVVIFLFPCLGVAAQRIARDAELEREVVASGFIHAPLPLDTARSAEAASGKKKVLEEALVCEGPVEMKYATFTGRRAEGSPSDRDYATYGVCSVSVDLQGRSLEGFNRIAFNVFPDCDGARVVNLDLVAGPDEPSHLVNLVNRQWNTCFLEIGKRPDVRELVFYNSLKGKDLTTGDSARFYIRDIRLQKIEKPAKVSGWTIEEDRIVLSGSGYEAAGPKIALVSGSKAEGVFTLQEAGSGAAVYQGRIRQVRTSLGEYGVLDFSDFTEEGRYVLQAGTLVSHPFPVDARLWDDVQWRALNFLFCQRCGYPVPGKHGACHLDLLSVHEGVSLPYAGGWHDAGDLSQQTLQTGDVAFALFEAAEKLRTVNPALSARLREEALWGLDFVLRTRFGDGCRASSMGLLIWTDGKFGTLDDISSVRVQDHAFDNYLYAGYEAYAALVTDNDPALREYLAKVAEEDFAFAEDKFSREGYDRFTQMYEHTYNTSKSQYHATMSWSASLLYQLTGNERYAKAAAEAIRYTLDCQQTEPLPGGTRGFFYRDTSRRSIVHYIHQSREQVYMQALALLCETQPRHPDYGRWAGSIRLFGEYLKSLMPYTAPYGMIPSGVYALDEYQDTESFHALHLFPPDDAAARYTRQVEGGVKIDNEHYIKRFPVWFSIFNGNSAILLSLGKSAAICGRFLGDRELRDIGEEQLYWMVGKNPFGASLVYGEGWNYPQMDSFSSGEMTGEMPVGIRSLGDTDEPCWPETNNACYKEVWVTVAGKMLSLIAEYY